MYTKRGMLAAEVTKQQKLVAANTLLGCSAPFLSAEGKTPLAALAQHIVGSHGHAPKAASSAAPRFLTPPPVPQGKGVEKGMGRGKGRGKVDRSRSAPSPKPGPPPTKAP
eukprot:12319115-Heterocapsa_arctica.AAC.1